MPPSFGNRDDNSITANPCGMKKKTAAINHISNDPGPNFAVVPRCLRPRTATRLNRIRSRNLSARTSRGVVCVVSAVIDVEEGNQIGLRRINREMIDEMNRPSCLRVSSINCELHWRSIPDKSVADLRHSVLPVRDRTLPSRSYPGNISEALWR